MGNAYISQRNPSTRLLPGCRGLLQFLIEYDNILFSGIAKVEVQPNLVTERAGDIANEGLADRQSVFLRQFLHMGLLFESVLLSARWSARSSGFITW